MIVYYTYENCNFNLHPASVGSKQVFTFYVVDIDLDDEVLGGQTELPASVEIISIFGGLKPKA